MLRFDCPACGKRLKIPPAAAGRAARCPRCRSPITAPGVRIETAPPPDEPDPTEDAAEREPPDTPPPAAAERDDEPEDPDFVPPRRRKTWRIDPLGMVLVGGLGIAVFVALGGVAMKLSAHRSKTAPAPNERSGGTTTRDNGPVPPKPSERNDERAADPLWFGAGAAALTSAGVALLVWRMRSGTRRRVGIGDDGDDRRSRPRRRGGSKGAPGQPVVFGVLLTIACLIGASFCWTEALDPSREYSRPGYESEWAPREDRSEAQFLIRFAALLLLGSVASWVFAMRSLLARLPDAPPAARWAVLGALFGGLLAIPVSQYMPVFGGWLESLSQPWSSARLGAIGVHWIGLSIAGALSCAGLAALTTKRE